MKKLLFTSVLFSLILVSCSRETVRRPKYEGIVGKAVSIVDETFYASVSDETLIKDEEPVKITTYNFDAKGNTVKKITQYTSDSRRETTHEDFSYDEENVLTLYKNTYEGARDGAVLIQELEENKGGVLTYKKYWSNRPDAITRVKEEPKSNSVAITELANNGATLTQLINKKGYLVNQKSFYPDKTIREELQNEYSGPLLFTSSIKSPKDSLFSDQHSFKYSQNDKMGNWRVMHEFRNQELAYTVRRTITYR